MLDTEQTTDYDTVSWIDMWPKTRLCSFYQRTPKHMPYGLVNVVPVAGFHLFRVPQALKSRNPNFD